MLVVAVGLLSLFDLSSLSSITVKLKQDYE